MALSGTLVVCLWQFATVHANYNGDWTALFSIGALQRHPPQNATGRVYLFAKSHGYDGQFYRYIAHDPFLRTDLKNYVDDARLRYRRILVPLLAYLLAGGRQALIDPAYELVFLLSIGLGIYWSCRIAQRAGLAAAWGLIFLALPAVLITADRLVVDATLAALTAAFVYYSSAPSWKLFVVLAGAILTRETGFLLLLAYCCYLAWQKQIRWAGVFLLSSAPALAWYGYLQWTITVPSAHPPWLPFVTIVHALGHPARYAPTVPFVAAIHVADYVALGGALLGFVFAIASFARRPGDPWRIAAVLFTILGLSIVIPDQWIDVYSFGRYYTPIWVCLGGVAAQERNPWLLLPIAMLLPRIVIQLAPQAIGIVHWIGHPILSAILSL